MRASHRGGGSPLDGRTVLPTALDSTIGRLGSKRQFLDVDQKILLVYDHIRARIVHIASSSWIYHDARPRLPLLWRHRHRHDEIFSRSLEIFFYCLYFPARECI